MKISNSRPSDLSLLDSTEDEHLNKYGREYKTKQVI